MQILTADHPRDSAVRVTRLEFGRPICIGRKVWIGGSAIILPGINIDDGAVIDADSVVIRDVPAGATVVGNSASVRSGGGARYACWKVFPAVPAPLALCDPPA